jgi:hypothetical protein
VGKPRNKDKYMTKNMTRKGLALGSSFALAASALVGFAAPAQASTYVVIPTVGTSTTMISGEVFSVKVLGSLASATELRWEIAGIDTATETVATTVAGGSTDVGTTTVTVDPTAATVTTPAGNILGVNIGAAQTGSVTVRAYVESGDAVGFDATYDTTYSAPVTVSFVKAADVVATTAITAPLAGDTSISAKISFNGINNEQLDKANVGAYFTNGDGTTLYPTASATAAVAGGAAITYTAANNFVVGQTVTITGFNEAGFNLTGLIATVSTTNFTVTNTLAAATATGTGSVANAPANSVEANVTWSATNSFAFTSSTVTALVKANGVKVQPLWNPAGSPLYTNTIGTAATATVAERRAATIAASTVVSSTAAADNTVLLNGAWSVSALVKDATTPTALPVAGTAVAATVTTNATLVATVGSVVSLTVNGTTHTSIATLPGAGTVAKLALVTDANGEVFVNLSTAGYTAAQTVTVSFATENLSPSAVTNAATAASYTVRQNTSVSGVVDGAVAPVSVTVLDQFGGAIANGYKAYATLTTSTQATTAATTAASGGTGDVVNGSATVNLVENGTGAGTNTYTISVAKLLGSGAYGSALGSTATHNVVIAAAADLAAGTVASSTGTKNATSGIYEVAGTTALVLQDNKSYNSNTVLGAAPSAFVTAFQAADVAIGGTVTTTASATSVAKAIPGAAVTISGAGLQFSDGSGVYSPNSITVYANAAGVYSAAVSSHLAGKQTITVTSGAASATVTVVFAAAAGNTGAVLTISAPDYVLPGSTLSASALLVDKNGNVVDTSGAGAQTFSFSAVSPGFQVGTNPADTDEDGMAKLAYFLGNNDSGTITLTAVYDIDGNPATVLATDRFVVTKTIIIGTAPAVQKVNAGSFKGYVAVYARGYEGMRLSAKIGKDWIIVDAIVNNQENGTLFRMTDFTGAGVDIAVRIYIDRVLIDTINLTTK